MNSLNEFAKLLNEVNSYSIPKEQIGKELINPMTNKPIKNSIVLSQTTYVYQEGQYIRINHINVFDGKETSTVLSKAEAALLKRFL